MFPAPPRRPSPMPPPALQGSESRGASPRSFPPSGVREFPHLAERDTPPPMDAIGVHLT